MRVTNARRRTGRYWAVCGLVLALSAASVIALRVVAYRAAQPRGQTLRDHLAAMPAPIGYRLVERNGSEHLAVRGPVPTVALFASGGPVYVFDRTGALVDWTPDAGDDDTFHHGWPEVHPEKHVSRADAESWGAMSP